MNRPFHGTRRQGFASLMEVDGDSVGYSNKEGVRGSAPLLQDRISRWAIHESPTSANDPADPGRAIVRRATSHYVRVSLMTKPECSITRMKR
jgi:hypothetical protein